MKNRYLKLQKPLLLTYLSLTIVYFIHALWFNTSYAKSEGYSLRGSSKDGVETFFILSSGVNQKIFTVTIITLVLIGLAFFLGNVYRKKFYISNFVISIALPLIVIVSNIYLILVEIPKIAKNWHVLDIAKITADNIKVTKEFLPLNYAVCIVMIAFSIGYLCISVLTIINQIRIEKVGEFNG